MTTYIKPTRALAHFVADTPGDALPNTLVSCVEEFMLDFTGHTAYSSRFAESSPAFLQGARQLDIKGSGYTVVGQSDSWSQGQAAMLNAAFAHTMDFDDTNVFSALHPGAPVIPAALAVAEGSEVSGRMLIDAISFGYEVICRVGAALGTAAYDRGFHPTAVAGIFGAVAAAGRLRGLDADTIERAFGLGGSLASGSMQYLDTGAWNKRLHPGFAANNALIALSFAQAGVLAAEEPIAGRFGLLTGYTARPNVDVLTDGLGERWVAEETGLKPYPSCRLTHGAIDAALALRDRLEPAVRASARLQIDISPKAFDIVGESLPGKVAPRNIVEGQFSVYFQTATAWLDGKAEWQSYERLGAVDVETLTHNMTVRGDATLHGAAARLRVEGHPDLSIEVPLPLGEPSIPLGRPRIKQKFMSLATPVFGEAHADRLADRLLTLRNERSAPALISALRAPT